MKLKYLFLTVLTSSILFAGCSKDESTTSFSNLKLDQSYLIAPESGADDITLTVTSTEDWKFVIDENWPEVITFNDDVKAKHDRFGNLINEAGDIKEKKDSWLQASVLEGKAGETKVTFTVPESPAGREIEIALYAGNNKQFLRIRQGSLTPVSKTCEEILESGTVGSSYIVTGTVSKLGQYAKYGAFNVKDETGEVEIYGSLKESIENYPNVEVGDVVKFSGVWTEKKRFDKVEIKEHKKSLLKITSERQKVSLEGGVLTVELAYKGNGVFPAIAEEYRSWISYVDMEYEAGEPSKLDPDPADIAIVKFQIAATSEARVGKISFTSHSGKESTEAVYEFDQEAVSE